MTTADRDPAPARNEAIRPQDRLQPGLLDRLTDDEPEKRSEPRESQILTRRRLRESVLRDLAWLFNATRTEGHVDMTTLPFVRRSVVNFGLPAMAGQSASSLDILGLTRALREAIVAYEPRILPASLEVAPRLEGETLDHHNVVAVEIRGQLWAQPMPMEFLVRTDIDLETGQVRITDMKAPLRRA